MPPFRQQAGLGEDSPEWQPPSYAQPLDEGEEWKPPAWAKAVEEPKKPSTFARIKEAVLHPKPYNPATGKPTEIPAKQPLPNLSSEERIKAANELQDPGQGDYFARHPDKPVEPGNINLYKQPKVKNPEGGISTVYSRSYNLDGKETLLPSVTPDGRFLKTDDEVINEYKKTGRHLGKFNTPDEADRYAEQLHKDYESGKYEKEPQKSAVDRFLEGVTALPRSMYETVNTIGKKGAEQLKQGDIHGAFQTVTSPLMGSMDTVNQRLAERKTPSELSQSDARDEAASQILGMTGLDGKEAIEAYRQGNYAKLAGMGLSAAVVGVALHKVGGASSEPPIRQTGIPNRFRSEEVGYRAGEPTNVENFGPPVRDAVASYIKRNPEAKMADVEAFVKSVKPERPPSASVTDISTPPTPPPDKDELSIKQPPEVPLAGPEFSTQENILPPTDQPIFSKGKSAEDLSYEVARDKIKMGPGTHPFEQPKFVNPFEKPVAEEWKPPEYAKPVEAKPSLDQEKWQFDSLIKKAQDRGLTDEETNLFDDLKIRPEINTPEVPERIVRPDITEGFGGSGHPESPEYVGKVLAKAGKGQPGLSVEPLTGDNVADIGTSHVVYRGKDGEPIAVAKIVKDQQGNNMVMDLAADKSKGLLGGRAMQNVGNKLVELGATESAGTMSPDAENFLKRMKSYLAKKNKESGWKPPEYAKAVEEPKAIEEPKAKEYTIENAPPNQRAKMFRGANEPVDVLFKDPESREIFGAGQSIFKGGQVKPGILDRLRQVSEKVAKDNGITTQSAMRHIRNYNAEVRRLGSAVDKEGGNITAPSFKEYFEGLFPDPNNPIVEMHGGLGGFKPSSRVLEPNTGPYGKALDALFKAMGSISEKRVEQDKINKIERAKRFAKFSSIEDVGVKGAAQSLSALKGEFEKVDLDKLKMTQPQVDSLFTAVKRAKITPGEKARGYTALFKLFNGEGVPQRNELRILDDVFGNDFSNKIIEMHGGIGAVGLQLSKMANTMKSMQNSISLAAPLRHGIGLIARKEFYPAFADMFKFFGNKEFYNESMKAIEEHPDFIKYKEAGGFFAKPGSLLNSEEEFLNSYVGSIPRATGIPQLVGASNRAYSGFLNKLRFDTAQSMFKKAESLGTKMFETVRDEDGNVTQEPTKGAKAITRFINNATGRGDLGSLNKMTNELNMLLWSPRMIASRINMLANPKMYMDLPKGLRREGLKSLLGIAALGTVVDTLAAYGGAKISTNILSTDYGKARFGTKLIDPWGGLQQYVVGAARFLAGKTDIPRPSTRLEIAGRFLANKESPAASLAHMILTSKPTKGGAPGDITTEYGQKTSVEREVINRFTPIFIQDLENLVQSEPEWSEDVGLTAAMAGASIAGMAQEYPEKKTGGLGFKKMKPTVR